MRLFTGLDLAAEAIAAIESLVSELKPLAAIRWTPAANLHITTKFIGQWPESRLEELRDALRLVQNAPVPIVMKGLGFFPRIFRVGIERDPRLMSLAAATEMALEGLGCAKELRPYSPHLTLARIPRPVPLANLKARAARLEGQALGSFEAREFHLYLSKSSTYTKLASFPLGESQ